jgi:hypothetical protein
MRIAERITAPAASPLPPIVASSVAGQPAPTSRSREAQTGAPSASARPASAAKAKIANSASDSISGCPMRSNGTAVE